LPRPLEPGPYTSIAFGLRCREAGVRPSMGSVGDAYDNALCESFFATLERELLDRHRFRTQVEARMAVFQYVEGWYNPHRLHSGLGYLSPIDFERRARGATPVLSAVSDPNEESTPRSRGEKSPPRAPPERSRPISKPGRRGSKANIKPKPVTVYETGVGPGRLRAVINAVHVRLPFSSRTGITQAKNFPASMMSGTFS